MRLADSAEWCAENKSLPGSLPLLFSQLDMIIVGRIHTPRERRTTRGADIVLGNAESMHLVGISSNSLTNR
jgi:hypothetical protein